MTSQNFEALKKFKNTVIGVTKLTDVYLMSAKKKPSPPKYVSRPFHGLIYKLSGKTVYRIGEEYFELAPGEVMYLPKGCSYVVDIAENGDNYLVNFDTAEDLGIDPFVIELSENGKAEEILAKMTKKNSNCEARHRVENMALLYEFTAVIQKQIRSMFMSKDEVRHCLTAEKYIAQNFRRMDLTVTEVAAFAEIDAARLRRAFIELCGMTPKEYMLYLRICKAKKLLVNSNSSIERVSQRIGFKNSSYFSRFFNEKTGFYPTEYRDKFKF